MPSRLMNARTLRAGRALPLAAFLPFLLTACDMPRDASGTEDGIRQRGSVLLGEVEGVDPDPASRRVLDRAAASLGASVTRIPGHGEELLEALEEGKVDLVFGEFADDSPWAANVHFGEPAGYDGKPAKSQRVPRFAFRNGENGWITRMEDIARGEQAQ